MPRSHRLWLTSIAAFAITSIAACTPPPPQISTLETFQTCQQAEDYIKREAQAELQRIYNQNTTPNINSIYRRLEGFSGFFPFGFVSMGAEPSVRGFDSAKNGGGADENGGSGGNDSAVNFSKTNVQNKGVDEADRIKNDDRYIYALKRDQFLIYKAWPPHKSNELARHSLDKQWGRELFIYNNIALIFTTNYQSLYDQTMQSWDRGEDNVDTNPNGVGSRAESEPNDVHVIILDIQDRTQPKRIRELVLPGRYMASRRLNGTIHIATYSGSEGRYLPNDPAQATRDAREQVGLNADLNRIQVENRFRNLIRQSTIHHWIRPYKDTLIQGTKRQKRTQKLTCKQLHKPNIGTGSGFLSLYTLNLNTPQAPIEHTGLISKADSLYASTQHLYIATAPIALNGLLTQLTSYIHKFDISKEGQAPRYLATGSVPGQVINQFAMDEYKNHLRIATTSIVQNDQLYNTSNNTDINNADARVFSNNVFVLKTENKRMLPSGKLTDLAPGERLFAVRFLGARGYLVTFPDRLPNRRFPILGCDPLFTLDLKDPNAPKTVGELKISGFSTYIHPLGKNHLLTIGYDGDSDSLNGSSQIAIFDIRDFSNPKRIHHYSLESKFPGELNELLYSHRAFNYFAPNQMLAFPFNKSMQLFSIDLDKGIQSIASFNHADLQEKKETSNNETSNNETTDDQTSNNVEFNHLKSGEVWRSVFLDDFLYTLSPYGMQIHSLEDLKAPIKSFPF